MHRRVKRYIILIFLLIGPCLCFAQSSTSIWQELFDSDQLECPPWMILDGQPVISPAFSERSLKLDFNDAIATIPIFVQEYNTICLSFKTRKINTESGDTLCISIRWDDIWTEIGSIDGAGAEPFRFVQKEITIPVGALADSIQIRFQTNCNDPFESFYIDDVMIHAPSEISVSLCPDPLHIITTQKETVTAWMTIANQGMGDFRYMVDCVDQSLPSRPCIAVIGCHAPESESQISEMAQLLRNTQCFQEVGDMNIYDSPASLDMLSGFHALYLISDASSSYTSMMADTLAEYIKNRGGLVFGPTGGAYIQKAVTANQYYGIVRNYEIEPLADTERCVLADSRFPHPIMDGVKQLSITINKQISNEHLTDHAVSVAEWDNGQILAAVKVVRGHGIVDMNLTDADWDESTNVVSFIQNSLLWAAMERPAWLTFEKSESLFSSVADTIHFMINQDEIDPDEMVSTNIQIVSNDLQTPEIRIPFELQVQQAPYYFKMQTLSDKTDAYSGETLDYGFQLINTGQNGDAYEFLCISQQQWSARILQTENELKNPNQEILPRDTASYIIQVDIPENASHYRPDTLRVIASSVHDLCIKDTLLFVTHILQYENALPWKTDFSSDSSFHKAWPVRHGDMRTINYSLLMDSSCSIESLPLRCDDQKSVKLTLAFSGYNLDLHNRLLISAYDGAAWRALATYDSLSLMHSWEDYEIMIPSDMYSNQFRLKIEFQTEKNDQINIRKATLSRPPLLSFRTNPSTFDFDVATGASVQGQILMKNEGDENLEYQLNLIDRAASDEPFISKQQRIMNGCLAMKKRFAECRCRELAKSEDPWIELLSEDDAVKVIHQPSAQTGFHVAVLGCEYVNDVCDKLDQTTLFSSITQINARVILPTLEELNAYDAVFAYDGIHYDFYFADSLGDRLADYMEGGGGVVVGGRDYQIGGRFRDESYYYLRSLDLDQDVHYDSLMPILPSHAIFNQVQRVHCNFNSWFGSSREGDVVAEWSHGVAVICGHKSNARRIDLGFIPFSSDVDPENGWMADTDGARLMANALVWAAQKQGISELLTFSKMDGSLKPYEEAQIDVMISAKKSFFKNFYSGWIYIQSNTENGLDSIGIALDITPVPFFFEMIPDTLFQTGFAGQSKDYHFNLQNLGSQTDSYRLMTEENHWPAYLTDDRRETEISQLENVSPGKKSSFCLHIDIPDTVFIGQKDTLKFMVESFNQPSLSDTFQVVTSTEWKDEFSASVLDTGRWEIIRGQAGLNQQQLYISGNSAIRTRPMNFSRYNERPIFLTYQYLYYALVEEGQDCIISCYTGADWAELKRLQIDAVRPVQMIRDSVRIPEIYFNDNFSIRFATEYNGSGWNFDDIEIVDLVVQQQCDERDALLSGYRMSNALYPNFPNPFNPATEIHYTLSETGHVRIDILNILGQTMEILVNHLQKPGTYQIRWQAEKYGEGLYFCRMQANGNVQTRKMLLIK